VKVQRLRISTAACTVNTANTANTRRASICIYKQQCPKDNNLATGCIAVGQPAGSKNPNVSQLASWEHCGTEALAAAVMLSDYY